MTRRVLVTGGAGFIGSYVCDELLAAGDRVRILDNLSPQVHGAGASNGQPHWPAYLSDDVERVYGDVRDADAVERALQGCDAVFHLAARVGVGQSMYEIRRYTDANQIGTATLLEALVQRPVDRLVVASSMSIYGEGRYTDRQGRPVDSAARTRAQMKANRWDPTGPEGEPLAPVATPEDKCIDLASVYALSKYDQERMALIVGDAYDIPTVALRFFNVYGPRQALSNPYTGVMAIFASRLLNNNPPLIFEDGQQQRDFVNVRDVARACRLAMQTPGLRGEAINIGSGHCDTIDQLAHTLAGVMNRADVQPSITGDYRVGDIRHCYADIGKARRLLGYEPQVNLEQGMAELASWLDGQRADDHVDEAREELISRGLTV
jgi:dTDP-L-rhamnose 4-epimerase